LLDGEVRFGMGIVAGATWFAAALFMRGLFERR